MRTAKSRRAFTKAEIGAIMLATTMPASGSDAEIVYLTEREAAELTKFSPGTLSNMRSLGKGPKFLRVGKAIRYRRSDLIAWIEGV